MSWRIAMAGQGIILAAGMMSRAISAEVMTNLLSLWRRLTVWRPAAAAKATNGAAVAGAVGDKPFGTGGPMRQNGPDEVESDGDHGLVIEAKAEKARLPRWS